MTADANPSQSRTYVFTPLEQRGIIAGLRTGQIAALLGGLIAAVVVLRLDSAPSAVVAAAVIVIIAVGIAFADVAGRPLDQWVPVALHFGPGRLAGWSRTRPGARRADHDDRAGATSILRTPRPLRSLRFAEVGGGPGSTPMAVVVDRVSGAKLAVLSVRGRSFSLLDAADKERRLAAWGEILASLAREGGSVSRLQWVQRTVGGDADALARHFADLRAVPSDAPPAQSYLDLVGEAGPLTTDHECFVVLAVRRAASTDVLIREMRLLQGQLRTADVDVSAPLGPTELGTALRLSYAPGARAELARRPPEAGPLPGVRPPAIWPAATEASWSALRADDMWHATFWVAEWPRTDVGPDFLAPLLLGAGVHRSFAIVMAPVHPAQGFREAEAARTAAVADEELRRRAGFLGTARRRREADGLARREAELSDGHAGYRFAGYLTVSAETRELLEDACSETVQFANQCRLDVRRLYGIQDVAFTWTLPLARGLR